MPPGNLCHCEACEYKNAFVDQGEWRHIDSCPHCKELVQASIDYFCPLDCDFRCPRCQRQLSSTAKPFEQLHCPKCTQPLSWKQVVVFSAGSPPRPRVGQRIQFLRSGGQNRRTQARSRHYDLKLEGAAPVQGEWWGEGRVLSLDRGPEQIARVQFSHWLQEHPRNQLSRLVLLSPRDRVPWMAVDYAALRAAMEWSDQAQRSKTVWLGSFDEPEWISEHEAELEMSPFQAREIFLMLLVTPTSEHQLAVIYDGARWQAWSELTLSVSFSGETLVVTPDRLPEPSELVETLRTHTPWWAEAQRQGERVVRWTQSEMIRMRASQKS